MSDCEKLGKETTTKALNDLKNYLIANPKKTTFILVIIIIIIMIIIINYYKNLG